MQLKGKAHKKVPSVAPPTILMTEAKPVRPSNPAPDRCAIDPTICYAIDGLIEGMEKLRFPMEMLQMPVRVFAMELKIEGYEMPEEVWNKLQEYTCEQQAGIIIELIRSVHLHQALSRLKVGPGPLGSLKGREHLALPIELAGETNCREKLELVKPLLPRFGLDKGATQGKTGGIDYPSVMSLFFRNRKQFFKVYGLEDQAGIYRFLTSMSKYFGSWPEVLSEPFRDEEIARDAINQIAVHYF